MRIRLGVALFLTILVFLSYKYLTPKFSVSVPAYQEPGELVRLDQTWTDAQRIQFHHTAQGTRLVPYDWFKALEQPCISLFPCPGFSDPSYLGRFGFIASKTDPKWNPDGFPIGFALQTDFHDPIADKVVPVVGLTCAACHTGELRYGKYSVLVEGAPATIDAGQFQKALGLAVLFTKYVPGRYSRFEKKVLGDNASDQAKLDLKQSFDGFLKNAFKEKNAVDQKSIYPHDAGFSRTDALTRIGNQVFAVDMDNFNNLAVSNAPVRFPQIWDASWLNWVQYNSSISDPMVRNIGESLGVRAMAKLYGSDATEFHNSVNVDGIWSLEELLAGPAPYQGLKSPKWPAVFPPLDQAKVARGEALYRQRCIGCHLPPVHELIADLNSPQPIHWWKNGQGKLFLKVTDVPVSTIGTDEHEATDFMKRTADTGALGKGTVSAAVGLRLVTLAIRDRYYAEKKFPPEKQIAWNGFRDPAEESVRALEVYKARPLNGIWAVGAYLHNGSVPSLFLMLSPKSERPDKFWTGSKVFDPKGVGRDISKLPGGYLFDTTIPGNSNGGHEFNDGQGKGVIGPKFSVDDRWALVEYLKSI